MSNVRVGVTVHKRTFEAKLYEKGSLKRAELNLSMITSEYMPSYRYAVEFSDGSIEAYRSKDSAEAACETLETHDS
jgi:hypothetical protein